MVDTENQPPLSKPGVPKSQTDEIIGGFPLTIPSTLAFLALGFSNFIDTSCWRALWKLYRQIIILLSSE